MKELQGSFKYWLQSAKDGSKIIYHTGFLLQDRKRPLHLGEGMVIHIEQSATVHLQQEVWQAHLNGHVELSQKKLGKGQYLYIATRVK